jgi:phage terminase large subunit-like protein
MTAVTAADFARWHADPGTFITEVLRDPETGKPFQLTEAEFEFVARAFETDGQGRLRYPELIYACPKKSGKTTFAAMIVLYAVLTSRVRFAEGYCIANDLEQAQGRVFAAIRRIVEACPWLGKQAKITQSKIEFPKMKASITAIGTDYAGAAGANPTIACFDELWAYTSERSRRLWDEMVPPPTRQRACRLTTTYAGFDGESVLLADPVGP